MARPKTNFTVEEFGNERGLISANNLIGLWESMQDFSPGFEGSIAKIKVNDENRRFEIEGNDGRNTIILYSVFEAYVMGGGEQQQSFAKSISISRDKEASEILDSAFSGPPQECSQVINNVGWVCPLCHRGVNPKRDNCDCARE